MGFALTDSIDIATSGLQAQSLRMRVITENLANAKSTAAAPGGLPYRRQVVSFANELDKATGVEKVTVSKISKDPSEFERRYMPSHPSADANGYVLFPNVSTLTETMDMREAQRSYEANLNAIEIARMMETRTIDLLRV